MWDNGFLNTFLTNFNINQILIFSTKEFSFIKPALLIFSRQVQKAVNTKLSFYKDGELVSKYLPIYSYTEQH